MYHEKKRHTPLPALAAAVLLALLLWLGGRQLTRRIGADLNRQAALTLQQNVVAAAVQCYAVEGAYPESLQVLEDRYGLRINREKFVVTYTVFGSNLLPDVTVLQK